MRGSVKAPFSERSGPKEVAAFLSQVRDFINQTSRFTVTGDSAGDGAWTNLWTSDPLPTDCALGIKADILCRASTVAQVCAYSRFGLFYNVAGTVGQQGTTTSLVTIESVGTCDVRFAVSGQTVKVDVKDDNASGVFNWKATVEIQRVGA